MTKLRIFTNLFCTSLKTQTSFTVENFRIHCVYNIHKRVARETKETFKLISKTKQRHGLKEKDKQTKDTT